MKDPSWDGNAGKFGQRPASYGSNINSSADPGSFRTSAENSHADTTQKRCIVDGGVLLETEQALLRVAPHLLAYTARIRKEGRVAAQVEGLPMGFRQYEIRIPREVIRQIVSALEAATISQGGSETLVALVQVWSGIYSICAEGTP